MAGGIVLANLPHRQRGFCLKKHFPAEFNSWRAMHERCRNPKYRKYHLYGGRGITVCERWYSFRPFLIDMGEMPDHCTSIERKDGNKSYEPGNCCWADHTQQMRNMNRNRILEYRGEKRCMSAWGEEFGISASVILRRLSRGWSIAKTLETPVRKLALGKLIEHDGEQKTLSQWAKQFSVPVGTLHGRLARGVPKEKAFTPGKLS